MALPKVCGIETEFGIFSPQVPDANPIQLSSLLVNAYVQSLGRSSANVSWDFDDEQPGNDARGWFLGGSMPPEVESHLVNAVLTNGARFYVDHAHPEYSGPECRDALSATLYDRAGDHVLREAMKAVKALLPAGQEIVVYRNNSDGKGNSYGTHENYLMDRAIPFTRVILGVLPFFVTRQIFCGAGKVGTEAVHGPAVDFQITQRADFFEEEVGLETTLKRPIVNTRDEPHADSSKYRRLHVIVGDANPSDVATYLKLGTTSIVLSMIEDGVIEPGRFSLAHPVPSLRAISRDTSLSLAVEMADGSHRTALDVQWEYFELAKKWSQSHGLDSVVESVGLDVLDRWESVLSGLETDPNSQAHIIDWVAKKRLIDGMRERHSLRADDARLHALDLQYHDIRPSKSLSDRVGLDRLFEPDAVVTAATEPPRETRAYFRGKCLQRFPSAIASANWDSVVFDLGTDPLRRVPMLEPLKGTAEMVDTLLEGCNTPAELLARLGA
jgi:Pup amidohydrolase